MWLIFLCIYILFSTILAMQLQQFTKARTHVAVQPSRCCQPSICRLIVQYHPFLRPPANPVHLLSVTRPSRHLTTCAVATQPSDAESRWRGVVAACSISTFLAALQRVALPAVAVLLLQELSLGMDTMGTVQASVLAGYVVGQIPSGFLADRHGGLRVLTIGLALWSAATACIATTSMLPGASALLALMVFRGLVGLGQSCMMPAVAATVARCVPASHRASSTSIVYACFSLGTVVGLAASTPLAEAVGWQGVFGLYGGIGMAAAVRGVMMHGCCCCMWVEVDLYEWGDERLYCAQGGTDEQCCG